MIQKEMPGVELSLNYPPLYLVLQLKSKRPEHLSCSCHRTGLHLLLPWQANSSCSLSGTFRRIQNTPQEHSWRSQPLPAPRELLTALQCLHGTMGEQGLNYLSKFIQETHSQAKQKCPNSTTILQSKIHHSSRVLWDHKVLIFVGGTLHSLHEGHI